MTIEKIVYPGKSLSRAEGQVIFTDEGLPGELVEIEIIKDKKNYLEARTLKILKSSPFRQKPLCTHYQACSPYQIMSYELELKIKSQQLSEIISRFLHLENKIIELIPAPSTIGYRDRIGLSLSWDQKPPVLSYHLPGSREAFLPVENCALVSSEVNALISKLNTLLPETPLPAIQHLEIRQSYWTKEILLVLFSKEEESLRKAQKLWVPALSLDPLIVGVIGAVESPKKTKYLKLSGRNYLEERINQTVFRYGPGCFFQVNPPMLEKVITRIKNYLDSRPFGKMVDLYAGIGTFGLLLADKASEILSIEAVPENLYYLKKNLRLNRLGHLTVAEGRSEEFLEEIQSFRPDSVVVDPPRKGLAPELIETLKKIKAQFLFYLSCNPTTLARDLNLLLADYELEEITGFDFFPRTPHIEVLARLKAKKDNH
ncbi:MAG: 23S rRNA (uracil(1939)-C(5))-methyltransferase RlmD [Candidatus Saccharicenans sp.]